MGCAAAGWGNFLARLRDAYLEGARQQAFADLDAHGKENDRPAVARTLRTAGQDEVGRIGATLQAQMDSASATIPVEPDLSTPQGQRGPALQR